MDGRYPHSHVIARADRFSDYLQRKYSNPSSGVVPSSGVDSKLPTPKNSILETDGHGLLRQELNRHLVSQYSFGSNGSGSQSSMGTHHTPLFKDLQNTPPKPSSNKQFPSSSSSSLAHPAAEINKRPTIQLDDTYTPPAVSVSSSASTTVELPQKKKQTVDDFESLAIIGRGAFGEVRLVRRKGTGESSREVFGTFPFVSHECVFSLLSR